MTMYSTFKSTYVTWAVLSLAYSTPTGLELMPITLRNLTSTALLLTRNNFSRLHINFNGRRCLTGIQMRTKLPCPSTWGSLEYVRIQQRALVVSFSICYLSLDYYNITKTTLGSSPHISTVEGYIASGIGSLTRTAPRSCQHILAGPNIGLYCSSQWNGIKG